MRFLTPGARGTSPILEGIQPVLDLLLGIGLVLALVLAATIALRLVRPSRTGRRKAPPRAPCSETPRSGGDWRMEAVAESGFAPRPLMNRAEHRLYRALEAAMPDLPPGSLLMSQVALTEVIGPDGGTARTRSRAGKALNGRSLDFALIDRRGHLIRAIELQGSGHYDERAFVRDAIKREALRKAGIALLEVPAGWDEDWLRGELAAGSPRARPGNCRRSPDGRPRRATGPREGIGVS